MYACNSQSSAHTHTKALKVVMDESWLTWIINPTLHIHLGLANLKSTLTRISIISLHFRICFRTSEILSNQEYDIAPKYFTLKALKCWDCKLKSHNCNTPRHSKYTVWFHDISLVRKSEACEMFIPTVSCFSSGRFVTNTKKVHSADKRQLKQHICCSS